MMKQIYTAVWLAFVISMQGCVTTGQTTSERLIGQWQSDVGGFNIVVKYDEKTVKVDDNPSVGYELKGNELRIAGGGLQMRVISFPGKNRMVQVDAVTGTRHAFTRLTP